MYFYKTTKYFDTLNIPLFVIRYKYFLWNKGFYYDFDFPTDHKISETDFPAVEKEMRKILAGNHDFEKKVVTKAEALEIFKDQPYKIELIKDLPETESTLAQSPATICAA